MLFLSRIKFFRAVSSIWNSRVPVSYIVIFLGKYFKFLYKQKLQRVILIAFWHYSHVLSTHFYLKTIQYTVLGIKKETSLSAGTDKNLSLVRTLESLAVPIFLRQDKETLLKVHAKHNTQKISLFFPKETRVLCKVS